MKKYIAPNRQSKAFNCPFCNVYAQQDFKLVHINYDKFFPVLKNKAVSKCLNCAKWSVWVGEKLVHPQIKKAPLPAADMPEDVKALFIEARNVSEISPKSAGALLRLSLQILLQNISESGVNFKNDISTLINEFSIHENMHKSMDACRITGTHAIYPGAIDIDDNADIVNALFQIINHMVDELISRPKLINDIYDFLHEDKKN